MESPEMMVISLQQRLRLEPHPVLLIVISHWLTLLGSTFTDMSRISSAPGDDPVVLTIHPG